MLSCRILGILNVTTDSFSDGGRYLATDAAIAHAKTLVADGADILDIGAQSSNVDAGLISVDMEWERISRVWDAWNALQSSSSIRTIQNEKAKISIDSFRPEILRKSMERGLDYWNDITALNDPSCLEILQEFSPKIPELILMFSQNRGQKASKESLLDPKTIIDDILFFFEEKRNKLTNLGIPVEKIIYDPGMGFFLGSDPKLSLTVLKNLTLLRKELGKILVSVSRKSFLGNILGNIAPADRNHATLAAEIWSMQQNVDYIRTHEPKQLNHSKIIINAIQNLKT
ncbi:dihydropteroate synthase [Leptospira sp. GIMC2001]|uniref:dihydropteroate synthase n=1 Tax=Leptospira sp. GIMC2001 TaxID=1513297 RepID=UPI00234BA9C6|nr:dihydropteroate synthase [Leptospira sp. GIMC2001]WCL48973.1 dihydropteroate synthase [Leptospira sp. GIMC2001]